MDADGKALVEHWDWAASKGLMNANTAKNFRSACMHVMAVIDDWENADVRTLDADEIFARFVNLKGKEFTPRSLQDYRGRFKQAVKSYVAYIENPTEWKPHFQREASGPARQSLKAKRQKNVPQRQVERQGILVDDVERASVDSNNYHKWQLLNGLTVELRASGPLTLGDLSLLGQYLELLERALNGSASADSKQLRNGEGN